MEKVGQKSCLKNLWTKFKVLVLAIVEEVMLFRLKKQSSLHRFETLGGVRIGSLKRIFWGRASQRYACRADMQNYIRYGKKLLMWLCALSLFNVTIRYTFYNVTVNALTITLLYNAKATSAKILKSFTIEFSDLKLGMLI